MGQHDIRLLVVEDEDAIRALLLTVLRRRGFRVDTARNGAEGLQRVLRCRYAVVLLDIMMPLVSGYEFLDEVSKLAIADRPVIIVLTAGPTPRNLDPDLVAGTLRKPFDIELLVDTITACLQASPAKDQREGCPPAESELPGAPPGGETN
ncbi:MAG TPA: response regulator [Thermoanaerobaculia bacterium]|nr:response regulator [Thermoanaerobaculia bacterium]